MHGDDSPQTMLFAELSSPPEAAPQPSRLSRMRAARTWRQAVAVLLWLKQPALYMPLRGLESDKDTAFDFPVHAFVPALDAAPLVTRGPCSIFAMADAMTAADGLQEPEKHGGPDSDKTAPYRVERDGDRVRVVRLLPEETDEWKERERARRARQRPPRPTSKAKTRSKALLDMIGEGAIDD